MDITSQRQKYFVGKCCDETLSSHQCGPGLIPGLGVIIIWVEFVVGFRPCAKRFFSGYSGFPLSTKTNNSKSQFDLESIANWCSTLNTLTLKVIRFIFFPPPFYNSWRNSKHIHQFL